MASGEASGKPWRPALRADVLASFAERARDVRIKFFDREGEPMSPEEWIEARTDPNYLLVAVDRIENVEVATTWIGLHLDTNPNWEHVIFGTQIVYLHPEDLARMDGPLPDPAEFLPADPEGSVSLLSLVEPAFGEMIGRYGWRKLSDAELGHRLVADDFRERFRAEGRLRG